MINNVDCKVDTKLVLFSINMRYMFKLITTIIIIIIVLVLESSCMVMKDAEIFVIDFPEIRKRTLEQFKNVAGKLL